MPIYDKLLQIGYSAESAMLLMITYSNNVKLLEFHIEHKERKG